MSVYLDPEISCLPNGAYRWTEVSHLFADTVDELHGFATRIGMRRSWFQVSRRGLPHYDLNGRRRMAAILAGAIPLIRSDAVAKQKQLRAFHGPKSK